MPRPTKADRKKPRPDRPRPTDAAPRGPKNFKLAVVALTAIALGATFFSGWLLWTSVVRDYLTQLRLAREGVWPTADDAIREALAGNPDAPRMQASFQALLTADQVLGGRADASRLPEDLKHAFAADWSNAVTRLCVATLAAARQAALGSGTAAQYTSYERIIRDGATDRASVYRPGWTNAWAVALRARGLSKRSSTTPGVQGLLTPAHFMNGIAIGALPDVVAAGVRLAAQLDADGNPQAAAKIRADVVATLRELATTDGTIANTLLCADLLLRMASVDPAFDATRRKLAESWNRGFRNALHDAVNSVPDRTEISQSPVVGPIGGYWRLVSWIVALGCTVALAVGAMLSLTIGVVLAIVRRNGGSTVTAMDPAQTVPTQSPWRLRAALAAAVWVIAIWLLDMLVIRSGPPWSEAIFGLGIAFLVGVLAPWAIDRCFWAFDRTPTLTGVLIVLTALAASHFNPLVDHSSQEPFRTVVTWAIRIAVLTTAGIALLASYLRSNSTLPQWPNPQSRRVLFLSAASATTGLLALIIALLGGPSGADAAVRQYVMSHEVDFALRKPTKQRYFDELRVLFERNVESSPPTSAPSSSTALSADRSPYNRPP